MSLKKLKEKYSSNYEYNNGVGSVSSVDEYSTYIVKWFRAVPQNAKLICRNRFTGKVTVKNSGFRFLMPWVKSKLISTADRTIDYPKEKYKSIDGIELDIDVAVVISITDPVKYELNNIDPTKELGVMTRDILRVYTAKKREDQLVGVRHTLNDLDANSAYAAFEQKYGIKVKNIYFKSIEIPQSLKDDYEKNLAQQRENERAKAELNARRERAQIEAEIVKIEKKADTDAIKTRIQTYIDVIDKNKTLTSAQKKSLLETLLLAESDANIIASINGGMAQEDMMKYIMSQVQKPTGKTKRRVKLTPISKN